MSLVLRFRQHLSIRLSQATKSSLVSRHRSYGQPAIKEDEEIDQRKLPTDYDPAEHPSPPSDRVFRLVDEISSLTLSEISELGQILMNKTGITELPTVAVMKPGAVGAKEEAKVDKTVFDVKLESFRSFTDLDLKEAKALVEKTPSFLTALGAKVVLE